MMDNEEPTLIERLHNEADQCRNDGADDIAALLDDAAAELVRAGLAQTCAAAEAAKSERRAIVFGDMMHHHILAMRAAVVDGHLRSPEHGLQWIANTLEGPGQLPDVDEAIELGGAQALFDAETAEHEAFRAAHPAP